MVSCEVSLVNKDDRVAIKCDIITSIDVSSKVDEVKDDSVFNKNIGRLGEMNTPSISVMDGGV
jgi:hypothetical protein